MENGEYEMPNGISSKPSKYNTQRSELVEEIPPEELEQALDEFSQGNKSMKKLLKTCIENNVKTTGCHSGIAPYIGISMESDNEKIKTIIKSVENEEFRIVLLPDGANPFSGKEFYKPDISLWFPPYENKEIGDKIFETMADSLTSSDMQEHSEGGVFDDCLDFINFFSYKESNLIFKAIHGKQGYSFNIEGYVTDNKIDYFQKLFGDAGLQFIENENKKSKQKIWSITSQDPYEFKEKLKKCRDIVLSGYNLERPEEIDSSMSFPEVALILRRKLPEEEFNKWLSARKREADLRLPFDLSTNRLNIPMKDIVSNAITLGITNEDVEKADMMVSRSTEQIKGVTKDE